MSGFEIAGIVLGTFPLVISALQHYRSLISFTDKNHKSELYSHWLRKERATFETSVQLLSQPGIIDSETYHDTAAPLFMELLEALNDIDTRITSSNDFRLRNRRFRWSRSNDQGLQSKFEMFSALNNDLLRLASDMTVEANLRKKRTEETISSTFDFLLQDISALPGMTDAEYQPQFTDAFNKFCLWQLDVKSEGLYKAMDLPSSEPLGSGQNDIVAILFRSVVRIIKVCTWITQTSSLDKPRLHYAIETCGDSVRAACCEIPSLAHIDASDLETETAHGMPRELHSSALTTIELVVRTLRGCLPATTTISHRYTMQTEDMQASDVTRLLDISMELINPVRNEFSKISELHTARLSATDLQRDSEAESDSKDDQTQKKGKNAVPVDLESIGRVFDEQAEALGDWKTKHMQDFELKLANYSPAKLASIADSVQNIATTLSKVNGMMKDGDTLIGHEQELQSSMKDFETFVQSLVAVGSQLDQTQAPPSYQSISRDPILIDLAGRRIPVPA